eukprot:g4222.t1
MLASSVRLFVAGIGMVGPLRALLLENVGLLAPVVWPMVQQRRQHWGERKRRGAALVLLSFLILMSATGGAGGSADSARDAVALARADAERASGVGGKVDLGVGTGDGGSAANELELAAQAEEPALPAIHDEERRRLLSAGSPRRALSLLPAAHVSGADQLLGSLSFVAAAVITVGREASARALSSKVGGNKRLHALTVAGAAALTLPGALWDTWSVWDPAQEAARARGLLSEVERAGEPASVISAAATAAERAVARADVAASYGRTSLLLHCAFAAAVVFVAHFYLQALIPAKVDNALATKASLACSFLCMLTADWAWSTGWGSMAVAAAFVSFLCGLHLVTYSGKDVEYVMLGADEFADIGRSERDTVFRGPCRQSSEFRKLLRHVFERRDSARIFVFLALNIIFMFVEVAVGLYTNSLGLIGDAGHMFFDNSALMIGLFANYAAQWHADKQYTFGYGRGEILAAFVNCILLCFIAISILMEAIERFLDPPPVHESYLMATACVGFAINMVGLFAFHDHSHGSLPGLAVGGAASADLPGRGCNIDACYCQGQGGAMNHNMHGVFLHIMADALGSLGVIVSSALVSHYKWYIADPICSLFISCLIVISAVPLMRQTGSILLQRFPSECAKPLSKFLQKSELPRPERVHS